MTATKPEARVALAPGSIVVIRDEEWLVRATEETADGTLVHVQGLGELVRDTTASFYTSLDEVLPLEPARARVVADDSPRYRTARLWLESTIRKTAVPLGERSLTVAARGLADALSYQQSAVCKALDSANLRPRLLLADAVGLGKTIEIGMILSELVRRGRGERILVVTPRHVLEQMQHELWGRFALPFVRLDSAGIQRVRQKLPATRNPFTYYKRVIISIDTLKSDRYVASLRKQRWDAVVIDESHNLSNAATLNNRLARLLARNAEALILASATPHNGRADSFAELLRLLDPSAVPAGGRLDPDEVRRLVVRRHRHSPEVARVVGADWAERLEPHNVLVPATDEENAVARELEETWLWPGLGGSPYSGQNASLFPWTLAKAFLSSPAALKETIDGRLSRLGHDERAEAERRALRRLAALNDKTRQRPPAKYQRLVEHLKEIGVGRGSPVRAVVFAERLETLRWLHRSLPDDLGLPTGAVALMHGGLADDEQQSVVEAFKQEQVPVRVLVTGDVASEGVNLHAQCHDLIHYDIPWSLIRIEQRNGRIDRYGQKHSPRITALLLDPASERFAGDVRILATLMEKENEAHTALGDVASLMGRYDVKSEEDDIRAVLAGNKKLDDVVRPVAVVAAGNDLGALFAQLFDAPTVPAPATSAAAQLDATAGTAANRTAALRRALDHYLHVADEANRLLSPHRDLLPLEPPAPGVLLEDLTDRESALAWCMTEHAVLMAAVAQAPAHGFDAHAWRLAWALSEYFHRRGYWHDWATALQAGLRAAQHLDDTPGQALAHRLLGQAYILGGRFRDAQSHLHRALALHVDLGDRLGEATTRLALGNVLDQQGDLAAALAHAERAVSLYETIGHAVGHAMALNNVGWAHARLHDYRDTLRYCQLAVSALRTLGDPQGEAAAWDTLGFAHHHLGQHREAVECYVRSIHLYGEAATRYHQADVLVHLGDAYAATGDRDRTRNAWRRAHDIFVDLDHPRIEEVRAKLHAIRAGR